MTMTPRDRKLRPILILMADDDEDDRMMTEKAMKKNRLANEIRFTIDGDDLMDYLFCRNSYSDETAPTPDLILLDLNMPKKDGIEALKEIKSNKEFKKIPVIVLTTSSAEEDIIKSYELGVNSFITKPVTFEGLVKVVKEIDNYWFELVKLPETNNI
jgi:CheY-like chemotaxis protein